jgi:predicted HTH transcriptional regulator
MTTDRKPEYLVSLIHELCKLPQEIEWVEFKENKADPQEIGEYLSALANSAALCGKAFAYLAWGIEDTSHQIVGTTFSPSRVTVGNEELESWLLRLLSPRIHFRFFEITMDTHNVVLLEIARAFRHPVQFQNQEYIRVGSYKKRLKDFPEKERELWRIFDQTPFEDLIAAEDVSSEDVLMLLDYPTYFDLLKLPLPETRDSILRALSADNLIRRTERGRWNITNLGAILLAKKLTDFRSLRRKAVRVIAYKGNSRVETLREQEGTKGYASGFEGLIGYINLLLPSNEVIGKALRASVPMYPELAIRELVANALIHQDFFITGAGPMIEIFADRMEICNPGEPLVDTQRFLDTPPRSRNEALASFMRRVGVCEERGSGVDKVVSQTELYQLPAPDFEVPGDNIRAILFAHRPLAKMAKTDRIRSCYLHACLRYVLRDHMTNTSLRERFGIEAHNSAIASRIIKETLETKLIRSYDESASRKFMKYVPFWA